MSGRIDLHTHSECSDGTLAPAALVAHAALRQVETLALTDHDTLEGCGAARTACERHAIRFLPGVELSCEWRGREVHVVGLNTDPAHSGLQSHCNAMLERRRQRIREIGRRLSAAGLPGAALTQAALEAPSPTRAHVARALHGAGMAKDVDGAFERWLQTGRPGHVPARWEGLSCVVQCVIAAGGLAVLAHPHRYRVSAGVLRELVGEFKAAGGHAIEVSLAGMGPRDADRAASLARRFCLAGSIGSDFHTPDLPWRPLGRFAKLPEGVTLVTAHLGLVT
jgi:predicted metal-dependent phosphoesterase TrpH